MNNQQQSNLISVKRGDILLKEGDSRYIYLVVRSGVDQWDMEKIDLSDNCEGNMRDRNIITTQSLDGFRHYRSINEQVFHKTGKKAL